MDRGLRVVRGPDWKWDNDDGGEGHVGTVVEIGISCCHNRTCNAAVKVLWDFGAFSTCRVGCQDAYDLRVFDNAPMGINHFSTKCDSCLTNDFAGIRWKCKECNDYDLCTECYMSDKHDLSHVFLRIECVGSPRVEMPKRQGAIKLEAKGIFVNAKVVRGNDWRWNDQDSDYRGKKTGEVYAIENGVSEIKRSAVAVKWFSEPYRYRLGYNGHVDLKCTQAAVWGIYYKDHLPIVGKIEGTTKCSTKDSSLKNERVQTNGFSNTKSTIVQTNDCLKQSVSSQTILNLAETIPNNFLEVLSADLLRFYDNTSDTDCCLKTKDSVLPAHRAILSARSTVFEAMFRHQTSERESGEVHIHDIHSKTLSDILYYIYSGKIRGLTEDTAVSLYDAADKYALLDLRDVCMDFLIRNLTVKNVCDAAYLAHVHVDDMLHREVVRFIKGRFKEVVSSDSWKVFKAERPTLLNEFLSGALLELT